MIDLRLRKRHTVSVIAAQCSGCEELPGYLVKRMSTKDDKFNLKETEKCKFKIMFSSLPAVHRA